jgi:hypothetical protein
MVTKSKYKVEYIRFHEDKWYKQRSASRYIQDLSDAIAESTIN